MNCGTIDKNEMMALLKKDFTVKQIAEKMNINKSSVYNFIIKNAEIKKLTQDECIIKIKEMLETGFVVEDIAKEIGRTPQTTKRYILQIESENQLVKVKEVVEVKEVKVKEYVKRKISYSGWPYRMCETWRF